MVKFWKFKILQNPQNLDFLTDAINKRHISDKKSFIVDFKTVQMLIDHKNC